MKYLRTLSIIFLVLVLAFTIAHSEDKDLEEINRLETLLLISCDEPLQYMKELVRLGQSYQELEKKRLSLYNNVLADYVQSLAPFVLASDPKTGTSPGIFRTRFDQLYEKAKNLGLLREASHSDIPEGANMAEVAANIQQYDERTGRYYKSMGEWASKQGLANKLFFADAQRQSMEQIKKELAQLHNDWESARREFLSKMAKDPYKDTFAEIDKIAAILEKDYVAPYKKYKDALHVLATSGRFEHCLGEIKPSQTYKVESIFSDIVPYTPGPEGTFEGLPGVGYNVQPPTKFKVIKIPDEKTIPEEFPLDLPLKYDAALHVKTEIERLKTQIKAEQQSIIAIGNYLSFGLLEGAPAQLLGEAFNVFHGITEGFASIGNLIIGVGKGYLTAMFDPVTFHEGTKKATSTIEQIITNSSLQREIIDKVLVSIGSFGKGVVNGIELLASSSKPPEDTSDNITLKEWKELADKTKSARDALTTSERLAGQILSDVITGFILSKGTTAQKLADDAIKTAEDLSKASQKANKLDDVARLGKLGDDVPNPKAVQALGNEIKKHQDDVAKIIDDIVNPKPKDIPYSKDKFPDPSDLMKKVKESQEAGAFNVYTKLDENLGIKVKQEGILKSSTKVDEALKSRASLDLDDAGRKFFDDALKDSSVGRMPQVKERVYIVGDPQTGYKTYRNLDDIPNNVHYKVADVVEHIPPETHAVNLAKEGKLTEGHIKAYETFMREINQKGYVWLDNKVDNFAFETIDASKGLYRVIPLDTGGMYKLTDLPSGLNPGELAGKIQKAFDKCYETSGSPFMKIYNFSKEAQKMGVPEDIYLNVNDYLGVKKINPIFDNVTTTWAEGKRLSSPAQPTYSLYEKVAQQSTESLKKEMGAAFDELVKVNPDYQNAIKALDEKKHELAKVNEKLNIALEEAEKLEKAATTPELLKDKDIDFNWLAAISQLQLTEADKLKMTAQCAIVLEKIKAGNISDGIKESWKKCQEMGITFKEEKVAN